MEFRGKDEYIKSVQKALGLLADGKDGLATWEAIRAKLAPGSVSVKPTTPHIVSTASPLSDKAYNLILKYEVGGGAT